MQKKGVADMAEKINITFPDGAVKEFDAGTTTEQIASSISSGLKKKALFLIGLILKHAKAIYHLMIK